MLPTFEMSTYRILLFLYIAKMVMHTMDDIVKERESMDYNHKFPPDMPTGPWCNDVTAKDEINKYAKECGFSVIFKTTTLIPNKKKGRRRQIVCDRWGFYQNRLYTDDVNKQRQSYSKKCGCPWSLWIEEIMSDYEPVWVCSIMSKEACLSAPCFHGRTHNLCKNVSSKNAFSSFRNIPDDLLHICQLMSSTVNTKLIYQFLVNTVMERGGDITFNYMDVFNTFKKAEIELCLDSTGVVQLLRENEEKYNLNWDLQHDQEGLLKILVFEVEEGKNVFSNLRSNVSKCVEL